ncbi:hypothetical protein AB0A74_26965 [Saccharothrix sp. NPDC042600]|uniref:hypothetical protein n=1 Tax=Saccharothrix TaxID=2071 RepID=UPI0033F48D0B
MDFPEPTTEEVESLLAASDVGEFKQQAEAVLDGDDNRARNAYCGVADAPVLVAPDIASTGRIPDLIPDDWKPILDRMIMMAVQREDWRNP